MTNDKLEALDKQLRELRKEVEDDLLKYKSGCWIKVENYIEWCSCGARQKSKCVKESASGFGEMCVKEFKEEFVPIPPELIARMEVIREKAEVNRLQEQTVMDAQQAFEMIENPVEANEKLIELLRLG